MNCFIIAALTVDGFIARADDENSTFWTSKEDAAWFSRKSKQAGLVVMGMSTYKTIGRPLEDRITIVYTRTPDAEKLVESQDVLEKNQVYHTQADPKELITILEKMGHKNLAISGGSSIYTMFMKAGLVERFYLTAEPVIFGQGISLFNQKIDVRLKLVATHQLSEQTAVFEYVPA